MDIVKALNSLDHSFSIPVLKKFEYGENLIDWIKILLCKQELGILNSASTTKYFNLEKSAREGGPISVYLFILALVILFFFTYQKRFLAKRY